MKQDSTIVNEPLENNTNLTTNWKFALMAIHRASDELSEGEYRYSCFCRTTLRTFESRGLNIDLGLSYIVGKRRVPLKLAMWKMIPRVEDLCVSGTSSVVPVAGLT
ncbi:hypothetical protein L6452_42615 [Arctium lappa]|uniref:Uncharacterized protein n=1 Tax=Arctium lappa TaxID=4217 RepID=A0ACB8XI84_ARCLA|nr:hypothetical protein L6452_42615 [Arctium lappa]